MIEANISKCERHSKWLGVFLLLLTLWNRKSHWCWLWPANSQRSVMTSTPGALASPSSADGGNSKPAKLLLVFVWYNSQKKKTKNTCSSCPRFHLWQVHLLRSLKCIEASTPEKEGNVATPLHQICTFQLQLDSVSIIPAPLPRNVRNVNLSDQIAAARSVHKVKASVEFCQRCLMKCSFDTHFRRPSLPCGQCPSASPATLLPQTRPHKAPLSQDDSKLHQDCTKMPQTVWIEVILEHWPCFDCVYSVHLSLFLCSAVTTRFAYSSKM